MVGFASFTIFEVRGKAELHEVLWSKIRYQGFLGDRIELANFISSSVVGFLHWDVLKLF